MRRYLIIILACGLLQGCAMKGDINRLEAELQAYHEQITTAESARAATLARLADEAARSQAETQRLLDSVTTEIRQLSTTLGDVRGELTDLQRDLMVVRELAGQSQTRLRELSAAIDLIMISGAATGAGGESETTGTTAEQLYRSAVEQLSRGRPATARVAFRQLLQDFPDDTRVPAALYGIGDSYLPESPDTALVYMNRVVDDFPRSEHAPQALYRIGLEAERVGESEQALRAFERVARAYGDSEAAQLACQKLDRERRERIRACR
ncbi:MAG: tetratricopeptide repeat protein [Gemmatimonadota bacterium]|nr:MAG: tetratricopeptide repeat protein [Gemmatimonadota bacterium]